MKLALIGVDYKTADIELREKISFTHSAIIKALNIVKQRSIISGAVIISTCNRTELYISSNEPIQKNDIISIFCDAVGLDEISLKQSVYIKTNEIALNYLFELSCGLHSMILGEDQIISQVNEAITIASQNNSSDSFLNTLFRHAVTCAKKVKSKIVLKHLSPSVASKGIELLDKYITNNPKATALVIGNGEVGRLSSELLLKRGCEVYMTLRTYKNKPNIVPIGCKTIAYDNRVDFLSSADIVVSATKSPHHTLTFEMLNNIKQKPKYIVDLGVPRDIDPKIREYSEINCFNVDDIGNSFCEQNMNELLEIKNMISYQYQKFNDWKIVWLKQRKKVVVT